MKPLQQSFLVINHTSLEMISKNCHSEHSEESQKITFGIQRSLNKFGMTSL